jgi:hypothetical protein
MSEYEKNVRDALRELYRHQDPERWAQARDAVDALDAILADHHAALAAVRDAALEEAALATKRRLYALGLSASLCCQTADAIRALRTAPASDGAPVACAVFQPLVPGGVCACGQPEALHDTLASVLPTAKVREVLLKHWRHFDEGTERQHGIRVGLEYAARDLGLPLGADGACTCGAPGGDPARLQAAHYSDCPTLTTTCAGCGKAGTDLCQDCEAEARESQNAMSCASNQRSRTD